MKSEEDAAGLRYTVSVTAESTLEVEAIEFVLDLPRARRHQDAGVLRGNSGKVHRRGGLTRTAFLVRDSDDPHQRTAFVSSGVAEFGGTAVRKF